MTLDGVLSQVALISSIVTVTYLFVVNIVYLSLTVIAIRQLRRQVELDSYDPVGDLQSNRFLPGVAVVVPAYNEQRVIVDTVESLLALEYPNHEVVLVNDGSTDETVDRIKETFDLERIDAEYPVNLNCEPVRRIYRDTEQNLVLIDKENGGKADALNAGLFFTDKELFCSVDADSLIERGALKDVVSPFLERPEQTVATGGAVRIANGCTFRDGALRSVSLPDRRLVRFQSVEYLRAFLLGRIGLSTIRSLLLISGAFGLFRADILREIEGFDTDSITEDIEIVVRLQRYMIDSDEDHEVRFLPRPVAWTEAPASRRVLSRQRRRWFRGLVDTLVKHRGAIGRPSYGVIGLFALPFYLFIETIGPLIEAVGYLLIPIFFITGLLSPTFFLTFLVIAVGLGSTVTVLAVLGEVITYRRYENPSEILVLLWYAILESFVYRPWRAFVRWRGLFEYLLGDQSWGKMTRVGAGSDSEGGTEPEGGAEAELGPESRAQD